MTTDETEANPHVLNYKKHHTGKNKPSIPRHIFKVNLIPENISIEKNFNS